jgi:hypothetical protein
LVDGCGYGSVGFKAGGLAPLAQTFFQRMVAMAQIVEKYPILIATRMACGNAEIATWLENATFAQASTGHWLAWKAQSTILAVLAPDRAEGEECEWIELCDDDTIESAINYVESGEFDEAAYAELYLCTRETVEAFYSAFSEG